MPNKGELLNQISVEITTDRTKELMISKIDLDYAYGQIKVSKETNRQCVSAKTGGNSADITDSKRDFTVLPISQRYFKIERTLEYSTPAWLDDIIVFTRGNRTEYEKKNSMY